MFERPICPACNGKRFLLGEVCGDCNGTGEDEVGMGGGIILVSGVVVVASVLLYGAYWLHHFFS